MTDPRPSLAQDFARRQLTWSSSEKAIARRVFEAALQRELDGIIQEAKKMANKIEQPSDLWKLEDYLTRSRKEIDRKYDFRYSALPLVFGILIRDGHLSEESLRGLAEDKLKDIRAYSKLCVRPNTVAGD